MRQWFLIGTDVKPQVGSFTWLDTHMISRRQRVRLSAIRLEKSHRAICEITLRNHVLGFCVNVLLTKTAIFLPEYVGIGSL